MDHVFGLFQGIFSLVQMNTLKELFGDSSKFSCSNYLLPFQCLNLFNTYIFLLCIQFQISDAREILSRRI